MIRFDSDYMRGAHPEIMKRLCETNMEATTGYGSDPYTAKAKEAIRKECQAPDAEIHLLIGGTQTNSTVIDRLLDHHEGILAADTSHVNVHESGAIEATGHKVIALPATEGKLRAEDVDNYIKEFYRDDTYEHMVAPGAVYISHPTELGTLYTLDELRSLSEVCRSHNIPLYVDGARLGYALAADTDISLPDLARLADVFYIGGTKVGALFGEAVVARKGLLPHFFSLVKQHGALLAKGRLLGIQFMTLFTDGLYRKIAGNAIEKACRLKEGLKQRGFKTFIDSPTNQQFFILPNCVIDQLMPTVATFEYWGPRGEKESKVRFVTDWATTDNDIDILLNALDTARNHSLA